MMEGNGYDLVYEMLLHDEKQLIFQLRQYALDREVGESDSVVKEIKEELSKLEEGKKILAHLTTLYKNK